MKRSFSRCWPSSRAAARKTPRAQGERHQVTESRETSAAIGRRIYPARRLPTQQKERPHGGFAPCGLQLRILSVGLGLLPKRKAHLGGRAASIPGSQSQADASHRHEDDGRRFRRQDTEVQSDRILVALVGVIDPTTCNGVGGIRDEIEGFALYDLQVSACPANPEAVISAAGPVVSAQAGEIGEVPCVAETLLLAAVH